MIARRELITLLGGTTVTWPLAARAQQPTLPVIGFVDSATSDASSRYSAAFLKGLSETGIVEGQNASIEYQWLEGQSGRLPSIMADLVRRRVAVIAAPGTVTALAAKAATT